MDSTRTIIKNLFYGFFKTIGCYRYYRYKHRHTPIVLTYHGVVPEIPRDKPSYEYRNFVTVSQFEKQIQFLLKRYRPMKVENFLDTSIPERSFLITFDDGFRNNYRYALPILKKYGLQACFFITTNLIETREFLWTDQVNRLIMNTQKKQIELNYDNLGIFDLHNTNKKESAAITIRRYMKRLHPTEANKIFQQLNSEIPGVINEMKPEEEDRYLFMNWSEVRGLIASGQIVGSHTHTHPILNTLTEEESYHELKISKELIENNADRTCEFMSYPNGEKEDYSRIHERQLQDIGYYIAFTQISPFAYYTNNPYELNRLNISFKKSMPVLEATLCGFKKS